jgi:homocysteine S-methyltransferase
MHKVDAGAEFIVTPPIFDTAEFEPVAERLRNTGLPVLAGLAALDGLRHAEFLASEVGGVRIPEAMFERLRNAADERAEALAMTVEIAQWLRAHVQGLQITTVHGAQGTAERLLTALGEAGVLASSTEKAGSNVR